MKHIALAALLLLPFSSLPAEEKDPAPADSSPSSAISSLFGSLKEGMKDIDMSALPKQISEMKANYAAQGETIAKLQSEVEMLKQELAALRKEVAALKAKN